jgi:hypothetical protein
MSWLVWCARIASVAMQARVNGQHPTGSPRTRIASTNQSIRNQTNQSINQSNQYE